MRTIDKILNGVKIADLPQSSETGIELIEVEGFEVEFRLEVEFVETYYQAADHFHPAESEGYITVTDVTDVEVYQDGAIVEELSPADLELIADEIMNNYPEKF